MDENGSAPPIDPRMEKLLKRSRSASVVDGVFWALMLGFGETYFIPLIIFLGATNFQVGLFSAAPQLLIAFAQFASIAAVERTRKRRRIVVFGAAMQSLTLFLLFLELSAGRLSPTVFLVIASAYYAAGAIISPAWNSLLGDLTSPEDRGKFFGLRNGLGQLATFVGMFVGGVILQRFELVGRAETGFLILVGAAAVSRLITCVFLRLHHDPPYVAHPEANFSFGDFVRRSLRSNFARFVYMTALMNFAVQMSAPYFIVYMLRDLGLSYMQYAWAQGVFIAVQFLAMSRWGPFADRYGNRAALRISGAAAPFIPLLWFLSKDYAYILFIQAVAGIAWAGWGISTATFIFDAVSPPKRARCAAYFHFFNGVGFFAGALFGAWLSEHAPDRIDTGAMRVEFFSPLQFVFLASAGLRFVVAAVFLPFVREVRTVEKFRPRDMFLRLAQIRPFAGARFEPFTGTANAPGERQSQIGKSGNPADEAK